MPDGVDASEQDAEVRALRAAYHATRALLQTSDSEAAQAVIFKLCDKLGASVVPAEGEAAVGLPINVTLEDGDPMVLVAESPVVERLVMRYVVPAVADAQRVVRRHHNRERLTEDATKDALTGMWNRRSVEAAINRAAAGDCIAMLDLDHFKAVNDTYGHAAGDEVLAVFAGYLRRCIRQVDIFGRLGGEEFVIIFPETPLHEACERLCQIRAEWAASAPYGTTFSAGVARVPGQEDSGAVRAGQAALALADALMYDAKTGGRNRVHCGEAGQFCGGDAQ